MADDAASPDAASPDATEIERELRALDRRVRRRKRAVERLNPVDRPDDYAAAFERLVELEVELRTLRASVAADEEPGTAARG